VSGRRRFIRVSDDALQTPAQRAGVGDWISDAAGATAFDSGGAPEPSFPVNERMVVLMHNGYMLSLLPQKLARTQG
jgi:hypothetical protein